MSDGIIDITEYLRRRDGWEEDEGDDEGGAFALWGADGERSRFALPLWRAIYLAEGERGAIVRRASGSNTAPEPFVILDLGVEPARREFSPEQIPSFVDPEVPELHDLGEAGLLITLGSRDGLDWFLIVDSARQPRPPLPPKSREDLLFLAGECAGLLFYRNFADEVT